MSFIVARKGTRPSSPKVYISKIARTVTFSAGFFREHDVNLNKTLYVRLAFDPNTKEIALEFSETKKNTNEYLKLTLAQSKTTASCSINPILTTFSINIKEISGTYKDKAISGPTKIDGFSDNGFVLITKMREV